MSRFRRFHNKTAPGARDGHTRRKNNWRQSPSCYAVAQLVPTIDRKRPGAGYRHLLLKRDIERFVNLIPNWQDVSVGLDVIVLDSGNTGCDGWHCRGVIAICAWPIEMRYEVNARWFREHHAFLKRIEARIEGDDPEDIIIHWSPWTARAYQLCHVFLHELGHHRDRMTTRSRRCSRGEDFAERYAWEFEPQVWERYLEEFGLPE
jgi:hypothetical protein